MLPTYTKQSVDQLDYDVDFTRWLPADDTITSVMVVLDVEGDMEIESSSIASPVVKVWLSGGTHNTTYTVTVTVATLGGRIKETEFRIRVKDI